MIDRSAFFGTVQIDQMQPLDAVVSPALSHLNRVVAEDGFLVVVSLSKPHTLATSKINSWKNLHFPVSLSSFLNSEHCIDEGSVENSRSIRLRATISIAAHDRWCGIVNSMCLRNECSRFFLHNPYGWPKAWSFRNFSSPGNSNA